MTDEAKALVERLRWGEWYFEDPFDGKAYASDDPLDAANLIETQAHEIERLREALEPFAFREMEKDEGLADTQYVWETIHSDRVQDWFSYEEIEAARAALGDTHD